MTNLLEPWVLLRIAASLVAFSLFARGAITAQRVLRDFDRSRSTEGQIALEKEIELASTFARIAAVVQVAALVSSVLGAHRMSRGVRGAMCAYGVFSAHDWGFRSLAIGVVVALLAGVVAQLHAFDSRVRSLELARPLAVATCVMAPLSLLDLAAASKFLLGLDLSVVASCCSVQLDSVVATGEVHAPGPRLFVTALAVAGIVLAACTSFFAARSPSGWRIALAALATLFALPVALATTVLEVAPHAFETPSHVCPFCLLRGDVLALGYPLYGALFLAATSAGGAAISALVARTTSTKAALREFATRQLRRVTFAWVCALIVGALPVVRYVIVSGGASLFAGQ